MSGVSNSSGHRKIASRPCSCDAVATALQKLVLKYDTACILSYGESRTNQASLIINAQRHPDKASAVGHLVCKLGVVPDANGNAVTVFELDSLPNAFLLYQPLHWSMDHLNGWVLVPSLQTLDRLIAELKRANRAWEQAFQVDLQAVRKLDFGSSGFTRTLWEPLVLDWRPEEHYRHDLGQIAMFDIASSPTMYMVRPDGSYRRRDDPLGPIFQPVEQFTSRPQHEKASPLLMTMLARTRIVEAMEASKTQSPDSFFAFSHSVELATLVLELYDLIYWTPGAWDGREDARFLIDVVARMGPQTRSQTRAAAASSSGSGGGAPPLTVEAGMAEDGGHGGHGMLEGGHINTAMADFIADCIRMTPSRDYLPLHVDSSDLDEPLTPPLMLETSAEAQGLDSAALDEQWSLEEQERKAEFEAAAAAALGKAPRTTEGTEGVEGGC